MCGCVDCVDCEEVMGVEYSRLFECASRELSKKSLRHQGLKFCT